MAILPAAIGCGVTAGPRADVAAITPAAPAAGASAADAASAAATAVAIAVDVEPVPLNPQDPTETAIGDFSYAGGLVLTSRETQDLHGLSDLEVTDGHRLVAVGDFGALFTARIVLDETGRLAGLSQATLAPLTGEDGRPLVDKARADAEGLGLLSGGDMLVSFERQDRIWLYPAAGGPPRPVPMPRATFPLNGGMEALVYNPHAAPDAYIVGAEDSGATWHCRLSTSCGEGPVVEKPQEFGLVAVTTLPAGEIAYLLRAYDSQRGNRVSLQIVRGRSVVARLDLAAPRTVDNYEGLAAVVGDDGRIRFYLLSDDNGAADQRTILLAFDWRPR